MRIIQTLAIEILSIRRYAHRPPDVIHHPFFRAGGQIPNAPRAAASIVHYSIVNSVHIIDLIRASRILTAKASGFIKCEYLKIAIIRRQNDNRAAGMIRLHHIQRSLIIIIIRFRGRRPSQFMALQIIFHQTNRSIRSRIPCKRFQPVQLIGDRQISNGQYVFIDGIIIVKAGKHYCDQCQQQYA